MFYVYVLFRPWNMIPCYVGKGKGNRVLDHSRLGISHPNKHLAAIIRKAVDHLPHEVVFHTDNEQEAFAKEVELIAHYGRSDQKLGTLCNLTDGGEGTSGAVKSYEDKAAISARMKGIPKSDDHKANLRKANIGKKQSSETIAKRRVTMESLLKDPERSLRRKSRTVDLWKDPEFRAKMEQAAKVRMSTPEGQAQLVAARQGRSIKQF